jgi:hypothetical protein
LNKKDSTNTKPSKREQVRAERRRRSLLWNSILLGGGALVVLLVVWYFFAIARPGQFSGEQVIPDEGRGHVDEGLPLTFLHYPPSSGAHYPTTADWGVYTDTVKPVSDGHFVHNLEHGGVVFLYHCETPCPALEQQFVGLFAKATPDLTFGEKKILVTPYDAAKMPSPIVALAWGHEWDLKAFDEAAMLRWYQRFVNQGPELAR